MLLTLLLLFTKIRVANKLRRSAVEVQTHFFRLETEIAVDAVRQIAGRTDCVIQAALCAL
ncbi:hypothetical protein B2J69_16760 [Pantoea latae]|uniref:Uncharacterized protein n=1 Tax=Pantoea latae TaxID=1964541 RepID=A0A1V9DDS4_9GAMM|nr:hypothetical protein B2J69_16760 [Pantoea latae]